MILIGFAEYNNVVFLVTRIGSFMVDLESLQFKKLFQTNGWCHPFESVYADPAICEKHILLFHRISSPVAPMSLCPWCMVQGAAPPWPSSAHTQPTRRAKEMVVSLGGYGCKEVAT
jgi:hypothetical protein